MIISAIVVTVLFIVVLFAVLFRAIISRPSLAEDALQCVQSFSLEAYAPMKRLLDEQDFLYLASLPGYEPSIARALRRERKLIYLAYLRRLVLDFRCLFAVAKSMVVYGNEDRSDLADLLWRQQLSFFVNVTIVRFRLAFYPAVSGTLDLQGLLEPLQLLQNGIQRQPVQA